MIQEYFLELDRGNYDYSIDDTAQIEPTHPEDPDELYRMSSGGVSFDVVFYPDRVEVMSAASSALIGDFEKDRFNSAGKLRSYLESLKPHMREAGRHGM